MVVVVDQLSRREDVAPEERAMAEAVAQGSRGGCSF